MVYDAIRIRIRDCAADRGGLAVVDDRQIEAAARIDARSRAIGADRRRPLCSRTSFTQNLFSPLFCWRVCKHVYVWGVVVVARERRRVHCVAERHRQVLRAADRHAQRRTGSCRFVRLHPLSRRFRAQTYPDDRTKLSMRKRQTMNDKRRRRRRRTGCGVVRHAVAAGASRLVARSGRRLISRSVNRLFELLFRRCCFDRRRCVRRRRCASTKSIK